MEPTKPTRLSWTELPNDGSLAAFAERARLDPEKLITGRDVLILPTNTIVESVGMTVDVFPNTTKDILVSLAENGLQVELYGDAERHRTLVRKSADVILPVLLFAGNAVVSIGLNILSNWLYERHSKAKTISPSIRVEYAELGTGGTVTQWRRVEGPADQVCNLLRENSKNSKVFPELADSTVVRTKETGREWWDQHREMKAEAARATADELISEGERYLAEGNRETAEGLYRRALAKLREAVLWEPGRPQHRAYLRAIGERVHDTFQCTLPFRDGNYWVECPVALSHSRGGFSVGGVERCVCSICGEDMLHCPHVNGRSYNQTTARRLTDVCNICGENQCGYTEGAVYDSARAFGVVTELKLEEVSFVENPANPLAVVCNYSLSRSDVMSMLPEEEHDRFDYGKVPIHCHHCKVCSGS